jgi:hypothetical protein
MDPNLKLTLVTRNSKYTMRATNYTAEVPNQQGVVTSVGYVPDNISEENPLGDDEAYLIAKAKMLKQQRDEQKEHEERELNSQQKSLESDTGFSVAVEDDNISQSSEQTTDNDLTVAYDQYNRKIFVDKNGHICEPQTILQPIVVQKKYNIRPIGE